jgi:glutamyl-Q tRNA(Asp) synthetase
VGSYLQARSQGGRWLVRIEDLDRERERPGAARAILQLLERLGFEWDGPVVYQSERSAYYEEALATLAARGLTYECSCSRKDASAAMVTGAGTGIYPGTCRDGVRRPGAPTAVRLRTRPLVVEVVDALQGAFAQELEREVGDFVLRRRDGWHAYQLAVVVDDFLQGVTEVVRGCDLLDSTPRQVYLQSLLGYSRPHYVHLPIVLDESMRKLSKQTGAMPIAHMPPTHALHASLVFLGQQPPAELGRDFSLESLWSWARGHWRLAPMQGMRSGPLPHAMFACDSDGT